MAFGRPALVVFLHRWFVVSSPLVLGDGFGDFDVQPLLGDDWTL